MRLDLGVVRLLVVAAVFSGAGRLLFRRHDIEVR
jgi:hypothetical protein